MEVAHSDDVLSFPFSTVKSLPSMRSRAAFASSLVLSFIFLPSIHRSWLGIAPVPQDTINGQYSGLKSLISFSRSMINLRATDCTHPAEKSFLTFFQRIGEMEYLQSVQDPTCLLGIDQVHIDLSRFFKGIFTILGDFVRTTRFFSLASKFKNMR